MCHTVRHARDWGGAVLFSHDTNATFGVMVISHISGLLECLSSEETEALKNGHGGHSHGHS